ncbi:MAG: lysylphosphatidylglycerol synthase transmembrane domain-containing protein [Gaiellaceae bacterium]
MLAAVPITPGGVGVVEATMTGMLVAAGAPAGEAIAAVLGYRLVSHWLPIVVGLLFLPTLVVSRRRAEERGGGGTDALPAGCRDAVCHERVRIRPVAAPAARYT